MIRLSAPLALAAATVLLVCWAPADSLNRSIFGRLFDAAARRRLIAAHSAWLAYRNAYCCLSESDVFEGGTEAGVVFADCEAGVNSQHVKDLQRFLADFGSAKG